MRKTFMFAAFAAALSAPAIAGARHFTASHPMGKRQMARHRSYGSALAGNAAAKTTASDVRLVSGVNLEYDGSVFAITDSFTLAYAGDEGGYIDERWREWNWNFETALSYPYSMGAYGAADTRVMQTFDSHGNVDTSMFQEWNSGTSSWDNSMRTTYTWDAAGNKLTETVEAWNSATSAWEGYYRDTYTYTTSNKVASYIEENWDGTTSSWENSSKATYTRDASDRMTVELLQFWNSSTAAFEDGSRSTFTYDASGNRTEELGEGWDGTAWVTYWKYISSDFSGLHQPGKITELVWNMSTSTFDSSNRYLYTFNSYNKPETYIEQEWDDMAGAWVSTTSSWGWRYHYEPYTTTGLAPVTDNSTDLRVFPVPASSSITVSVAWADAQPFNAVIADVSGRVYAAWTVRATKQYQETVPVSHLPAGQYVVTLNGRSGAVNKTFTVVR